VPAVASPSAHVSLHISRHSLLGGGKVVLRGRVRPRGAHRIKLVFRGPYVAGRDFDLTAATRERLGFPGVGILLSSR